MSTYDNERAEAAAYFRKIDELVGVPGSITTFGESEEMSVMAYRDVPEPDHTTMFSFGLSRIPRKEWILGRPELVLSVRSDAPEWADCMGDLIHRHRSDVLFAVGTVLRLGRPLAPDCRMTSMLVFYSELLDPDQGRMELGEQVINVVQLYPIYEEEGDLIMRIGASKFFFELDIEFEDVRRPSMAGAQA